MVTVPEHAPVAVRASLAVPPPLNVKSIDETSAIAGLYAHVPSSELAFPEVLPPQPAMTGQSTRATAPKSSRNIKPLYPSHTISHQQTRYAAHPSLHHVCTRISCPPYTAPCVRSERGDMRPRRAYSSESGTSSERT